MQELLKKDKRVDVLIIAEGTYPYIRGGVSAWIHELISGLPEKKFGVMFLGSRKEDYGEPKYEFPKNLVYLSSEFLFDFISFPLPKKIEPKDEKIFEYLKGLHMWFKGGGGDFPQELKNLEFYTEKLNEEIFLYSKKAWDFITHMYAEFAEDYPFIDYFWTIRNMHIPIFKVAKLAKNPPDFDIVHSPSTGYAGFLGALLAYSYKRPFVITEHGIYTRERKIDILNSEWLLGSVPFFLKSVGEPDHIKYLWTAFFEGIGRFAYYASSKIISLFADAKDIQISLGAPPERCVVIPNGVNVEVYAEALRLRPSIPPKVITLLGRVVSIKDVKTFIKAMRIVTGKIPEAEGWIVGPTDEDPDYYEECKKLVEFLNLEKNVKFLGFQKPLDIFPKTGILTLTSISEGMPLSVLEGFAAGLPCVATDVGSCRQLIYGGLNEEDINIGKAGEVVPIANPEALAKAYIEILKNAELWESYHKAAIKRVNRFYTKEEFLNNYREVYNSLQESIPSKRT